MFFADVCGEGHQGFVLPSFPNRLDDQKRCSPCLATPRAFSAQLRGDGAMSRPLVRQAFALSPFFFRWNDSGHPDKPEVPEAGNVRTRTEDRRPSVLTRIYRVEALGVGWACSSSSNQTLGSRQMMTGRERSVGKGISKKFQSAPNVYFLFSKYIIFGITFFSSLLRSEFIACLTSFVP
jgi:hypothetical protein